jgi:hypothetical protein
MGSYFRSVPQDKAGEPMDIGEKKRLLIPLTNPRLPSPWARRLHVILRPPFLALGFVLGNLYKVCFGWLDRHTARQNERRFAGDIRTHLSFLFTDHAAKVIPNEGVPFPPRMDGAFVTVAVGAIRLRFIRGCGDFSVKVSSGFAPQHWEDFFLVADGVAEWDTDRRRGYSYSLRSFGSVLSPRLARLQEALSKERCEATLRDAVRAHNESVEAYATNLRQSGIIPKIY